MLIVVLLVVINEIYRYLLKIVKEYKYRYLLKNVKEYKLCNFLNCIDDIYIK